MKSSTVPLCVFFRSLSKGNSHTDSAGAHDISYPDYIADMKPEQQAVMLAPFASGERTAVPKL